MGFRFGASEKDLAAWAGQQLYDEALAVANGGGVAKATFDGAFCHGEVTVGGRTIKTSFKVSSNRKIVESMCPCAMNRMNGRVCIHVVAVGIALHKRENSPEKQAIRAIDRSKSNAIAKAEKLGEFIDRATVGSGGTPAEIRIRMPRDWEDVYWSKDKPIECGICAIIGGLEQRLDKLPKNASLALQPGDEALLSVAEEICAGTPGATIQLTRPDVMCILDLLRAHNMLLYREHARPATFEPSEVPAQITLDFDHENGELLIMTAPLFPGDDEPDPRAKIVAFGNLGFVSARNKIWKLANPMPREYQSAYGEVTVIPREFVTQFIAVEVPRFKRMAGFRVEAPIGDIISRRLKPKFSLRLKGSLASVAASLHAVYDDSHSYPANVANNFSIPDPDDIYLYGVQDRDIERAAVEKINSVGFSGVNGGRLEPITGERTILTFLASGVPMLRRRGWKVEMTDKLRECFEGYEMAVPVVKINPGKGWFDVTMQLQDSEGGEISQAEIQTAMNKGESFLEHNGKRMLFDSDSIRSMREVFADCAPREGASPGSFRLSEAHAPYVLASLQALDGVELEEPVDWRENADARNRQNMPVAVRLGEPLDSILRPYQKEGVSWLRFMESNGVCGILADEMGLGKTLQTLAWLSMDRLSAEPDGQKLPTLIVCPTSLVENWKQEANKFVPHMKVIVMSGAHRHELWSQIQHCDIAITSYALLRKDIEQYVAEKFSCAVLDEAQHIKNRTTQNARAVNQIQARQRLVLTGTPVENSVADLWSIMAFLMPGYLGGYESFRERYEIPMAESGNPASEDVRIRLRRKLQPFLLRRKKCDVAKDLPEKIVKISYCDMGPEQRQVYEEILASSRERISDMVSANGFDRSRMDILAMLMRLRQACCHTSLIREDGRSVGYRTPSAKMEQFLELLDEAMSDGHRMLVFSQFVGMLSILRRELDRRGIRYSYLDGATKDRLERCREFNRDESIPVFLISLRAGGTGLNLTGADMVVHYDPWWNPAVEDQATDRAHRIGQKKTVYALKLITMDSVEERVLELQRRKQAIIGSLVEGDEQTMEKLTWEDIKNIIGLE